MPPLRLVLCLFLYACFGLVLGALRGGPGRGLVYFILTLGALAVLAGLHRRAAIRLGVPGERLWANRFAESIEIGATPEAALLDVARIVEERLNGDVSINLATNHLHAKVRKKGGFPSSLRVMAEPSRPEPGAGCRLTVTTSIPGSMFFDFGRSWALGTTLTDELRRTSSRAESG